MRGIYLINERKSLGGLSRNDSTLLQLEALTDFIRENCIQVVKLNPYQLYDHYTVPHALLYDLKQKKPQLDCLLMYSQDVIEEFISVYPARWILVKSYFDDILTVKQSCQLG